MKKIFFLLLALTIMSCSKVVPVLNQESDLESKESTIRDLEEALRWAEKSISILGPQTKSNGSRKIESWSIATTPATKVADAEEDPLFYVFNFEDNAGFSIIAASNSVQPILAVTESGRYVPGESTGNESFDYFIDKMINTLSFEGIPREEYYWYDYEMVGDSCSRRVPVSWGQGVYSFHDYDGSSHEINYGRYCPNGCTGCAAVAIGQVMAYHRYPQTFTTSCSMGTDYSAESSVSINWNYINNHPANYHGNDNCSPYHNSISALLREIGYRASTTYSIGSVIESGTPMANIQRTVESFGMTCSNVTSYSWYQAESMLKRCGPVILHAIEEQSQKWHSWVMDAYKDYTYSYCRYERAVGDGSVPIVTRRQVLEDVHLCHFNWGYYGDCNGWFAIGEYDTRNADSFDDDHTYNWNLRFSDADIRMTIIGDSSTILL